MSAPANLHATEPMRLYIAGPMSGIEGLNHPAFHAAAARLRHAGFVVENPAENAEPCQNPTWDDWMALSLAQLARCDGVALLPGWSLSRGAGIEFSEALRAGKRARPLNDWLGADAGQGAAA